MDYILYFVFAGIIVIALIIYWVIEFLIAKKIKLKAIEELDKQISEEEAKKTEPELNEVEIKKPVVKKTSKTTKKKSSSTKKSSKK